MLRKGGWDTRESTPMRVPYMYSSVFGHEGGEGREHTAFVV